MCTHKQIKDIIIREYREGCHDLILVFIHSYAVNSYAPYDMNYETANLLVFLLML